MLVKGWFKNYNFKQLQNTCNEKVRGLKVKVVRVYILLLIIIPTLWAEYFQGQFKEQYIHPASFRMFSTGYYNNRYPIVLNSKYPQVGGSSGDGGGRAGFVNRLIGAIFASPVCHSASSPFVSSKSRVQTLPLSLVRVVGPLLSGQLARDVGPAQRAACGLWSAPNWIKPASASARNGLHLVSFLGLLLTWPAIAENKQKGTRSEDNQKQGRCLWDLELGGPLEKIVNGDKTKSWTAYLAQNRPWCRTTRSTRPRAQCQRASWATWAWWAADRQPLWAILAICRSETCEFGNIWGADWEGSKELVS